MSIFHSASLIRRVCFLSAATILIMASVNAQSTSSSEATSSSSLIAESSSRAFPFLADDSFGEAAAQPSASAASGAGAGKYQGGWKQNLGRNFAFEAGGGFNAPIGNDTPFITWGGNFTVGGGLHISKRISLLAEYQFMDNKLPGGLIADAGAQGGHAHIWSLTLDPVIDLFPQRTNSVYVTGGGGFYRKVTSFTDPELVEECYYFCEIGTEDVVVSHFSSNQGGANFGVGFTHRLGGAASDSKTKLFAEVRYVYLNTPPIGETNGLGTTELIPVTFGLRW
jgi:hypothetical protein